MNLLHGDCLDRLRELPDNSVDSVVTDPPYGLAFMGKKWDYDVPSVEVWREVLRVLKPGGHLLSFGGTRTYHRMASGVEDAGFEIRDQIQWLFGSGFPKSMNLGNGWGPALKPANEPIVLARKPISEKIVAANILKWGTGGINVDECRVGPAQNTKTKHASNGDANKTLGTFETWDGEYSVETKGRFPANLILDEEAGALLGEAARFFYCAKASKSERNAGCEGLSPKAAGSANLRTDAHSIKNGENTAPSPNHHPTVKPIKLMEYLCKLITPPNGTILDPFMGSGSTGVAAKNLGFGFIGIEREAEYLEIAQRRIGA